MMRNRNEIPKLTKYFFLLFCTEPDGNQTDPEAN